MLDLCIVYKQRKIFLPVGRLVTSGGMEAVMEYYKSLGSEYEKALCDMFVSVSYTHLTLPTTPYV